MNDKFVSSKTFKTAPAPKKFVDYDTQYIKALNLANPDIDSIKEKIKSFRSDFGIPYNKRLNKEMKNKWIEYYNH